jgi:fibronectin type 3 domain-containing protein
VYYRDASDFDFAKVTALGGTGYSRPHGQPGTVYTEEVQGPFMLTSHTPAGFINEINGAISLRFNSAVDPESIWVEDVTLTGPTPVVWTGISPIDDNTWQITFSDELMDGHYTLSVGPEIAAQNGRILDQNQNGIGGEADDLYIGTFILDSQNPTVPVISSHTFGIEPLLINSRTLQISGTRDADSAIWINGVKRADMGSNNWGIALSLNEGLNTLILTARDAAGNESDPVEIRFMVDSIAPVINSAVPTDNLFAATAPLIELTVTEAGSGLDLSGSTLTLARSGVGISGQWIEQGNKLTFSPTHALAEGTYQLNARLKDRAGNLSAALIRSFTLDWTAPMAPGINEHASVTTINQIALTGTREPWTAVHLNGQSVVGVSASTTWVYTASLSAGTNTLSFTSMDRAGNISPATVATIRYDDTSPGAVAFTANGEGSGSVIQLNWSLFDEVANGNDIDHYRVYQSATPFSHISQATIALTTPAGVKQTTLEGLERDQIVHLAVVAFDEQGLHVPEVVSVEVQVRDIQAPANPTGLQVFSGATDVVVEWTGSVSEDLDHYRVYFDGAQTADQVTTTRYERGELAAASSRPVRITAVDGSGNESSGVTIQAITLLPNPVGVQVKGQDGRVDLSWSAIAQSGLVKHYAVYVGEQPFTNVSGMTPRTTTTGLSARIAGLTNDQSYYLAVTSVNHSGGESAAVISYEAMPHADTDPPEITLASYRGEALVAQSVISENGELRVEAEDESGVARVEWWLGEQQLGSDNNPANGFTWQWNLADTADGAVLMTIKVTDTLGLTAELSYPLTVALAPPSAPAITSPVNGHQTNQSSLSVTVQSQPETLVEIRLNGEPVAPQQAVDAQGKAVEMVTLTAGTHQLSAVAINNRGALSEISAAVEVTYDDSLPDTPQLVTATSRQGGVIELRWAFQNGVSGYQIYRSDTPGMELETAELLTPSLLKTGNYTDLPFDDGTWYYRVVSVNALGTSSLPSSEVSALSDGTGPRALEIRYQPQGVWDEVAGRTSHGRVDVELTVSEPLLTRPFLSLTPESGLPILIELQAQDETHYLGHFEIRPETSNGLAYAVFSARDKLGNSGTEIDAGATLWIDTQGPVATLSLTPRHPIQNDANHPAVVTVDMEVNEPLASGSMPQLRWRLTHSQPVAQEIVGLQAVGENRWRGEFTLPSEAGEAEPEHVSFEFEAQDALENTGTTVYGRNRYQVYQGDLPPLGIPEGLSARALAGGQVELAWSAVEEAQSYQLYRRIAGEGELEPLVRSGEVSYIDTTPNDGEWEYAVASVRYENASERLSEPSDLVAVTSRATQPFAPVNLTQQLQPRGMALFWEDNDNPEGTTYRVYRANAEQIDSVEGLTALTDKRIISKAYLDATPSHQAPGYVVTAVDEVGNESAPSNTVYENIALLPVSSLTVELRPGENPELTWSHPRHATLAGYRIYLDGAATATGEIQTGQRYIDTGYGGQTRRYALEAIDQNQVASLKREIVLPALEVELLDVPKIARGLMNPLRYRIVNRSDEAVGPLTLKTRIKGREHSSESFMLEAQADHEVTLVVGGYHDLAGVESQTTILEIAPEAGESVRLISQQDLLVVAGALLMEIEVEELVRGADTGRVRWTLENTSAVEIEVVTALSGDRPSNEVEIRLSDLQNNGLGVQSFKQSTGERVVALATNQTVARIAAGARFTSGWQQVQVPSGAPDEIRVGVELKQIRYKTGYPEAVAIKGLSVEQQVQLNDTPYFGEIVSITPRTSFGQEPVVIQGRAVDRATAQALSGAPLKLLLRGSGFERRIDLQSDAQGEVEYRYQPNHQESGIFTVALLHPSIQERPVHDQFAIGRVIVSPTLINMAAPYGIEQTLPIQVRTGSGAMAHSVRLEYREEDQPGGSYPVGLEVVLPPVVNLDEGAQRTLNLKIRGSEQAARTGQVILRLMTHETGVEPVAMIVVNTRFAEAVPTLTFSPSLMEKGVQKNQYLNASVMLGNRGFTALTDVMLLLEDAQGQPAPGWARLLSPSLQGTIAVREQRSVQLVFEPDDSVPEGGHDFYLKIESANHPARSIPVRIWVTTDEVGGLLFKISDIYTGTLNQQGELIEGLGGATVNLMGETVVTNNYSGRTDSKGEMLFQNVPAGTYRYDISASNRQKATGRVRVMPGMIQVESAFLDSQLISVEWSVREINIDDRYEINLEATYEVDVPTAVVVAEPMSVNLPLMKAGEVFYGEVKLSNHGLIRAQNIRFNLPEDDEYLKYELLTESVPYTIEARSHVVIPYRVIQLRAFQGEENSASGGSEAAGECIRYQQVMECTYDVECANGETLTRTVRSYFYHQSGDCSTASGGSSGYIGGSGGSASYGGWGGYGGTGGFLPAPTEISGLPICRPVPDSRECRVVGGNYPGM